jgi:hypothetical protein
MTGSEHAPNISFYGKYLVNIVLYYVIIIIIIIIGCILEMSRLRQIMYLVLSLLVKSAVKDYMYFERPGSVTIKGSHSFSSHCVQINSKDRTSFCAILLRLFPLKWSGWDFKATNSPYFFEVKYVLRYVFLSVLLLHGMLWSWTRLQFLWLII